MENNGELSQSQLGFEDHQTHHSPKWSEVNKDSTLCCKYPERGPASSHETHIS